MFSDPEWSQLLDKLRQLTEGSKITWEYENSTLFVDVKDVTYVITAKDGDDSPPWMLRVRKGTDADWSELDVIQSIGGMENDTAPGTKVAPLRDLALRSAMGGPKLFESLLDELDAIDPTRPPNYGTPF